MGNWWDSLYSGYAWADKYLANGMLPGGSAPLSNFLDPIMNGANKLFPGLYPESSINLVTKPLTPYNNPIVNVVPELSSGVGTYGRIGDTSLKKIGVDIGDFLGGIVGGTVNGITSPISEDLTPVLIVAGVVAVMFLKGGKKW